MELADLLMRKWSVLIGMPVFSTVVLKIAHGLGHRKTCISPVAKGVVDGDSFIAGERSPVGVCEKNRVDVALEVVLSACRRREGGREGGSPPLTFLYTSNRG